MKLKANSFSRVEMYTYTESKVDPSVPASAAPNTPALSHKTNANLHVDSTPRAQAPTSSPLIPAQVPPHGTSPAGGGDLHLSSSEPRIYPGMISRRQRTNSLRQSSTHEGDERASARRVITEAVDEEGGLEGGEAVVAGKGKGKEKE